MTSHAAITDSSRLPASRAETGPDSPFGRLTIDLGAVTANHRIIRQQVGPDCTIAGIVKADAYGTGMMPVVQTMKAAGVSRFFVATPDEAFRLRATLPDSAIAVLGGSPMDVMSDYIESGIDPVLNSLHDIDLWRDRARRSGKILPAIIHLDTGMNRLGLSIDEGLDLARDPARLSGLNVQIVMSHFACADEKDHPLTAQQYERFRTFAAHFPKAKKSLANSSGLFRSRDYHFDMVRPGIASYGGNPTPETKNPMKPVVTLEARILQIRNIKKGETIGYSATHTYQTAGLSATVALGYADGFHRAHSGKATLYWRGQPCPVIGRVSMDLVTVDLSNLRETLPQPGDWLEVLGPHQDVDRLAQTAGTISYEVLTNLGSRYQRIYKETA